MDCPLLEVNRRKSAFFVFWSSNRNKKANSPPIICHANVLERISLRNGYYRACSS